MIASENSWELYITKGHGGNFTLKKITIRQSYKSMLVNKTLLWSINKNIWYFEKKALHWSNLWNNGYLPRKDSWVTLWGDLWYSINYALPDTTISKDIYYNVTGYLFLETESHIGEVTSPRQLFLHIHSIFQGVGPP